MLEVMTGNVTSEVDVLMYVVISRAEIHVACGELARTAEL